MYLIFACLMSFAAQAVIFYILAAMGLPWFVVMLGGFSAMTAVWFLFYVPEKPARRRFGNRTIETF